jgi:diguanylate cyclase (GGDEF)-like protein
MHLGSIKFGYRLALGFGLMLAFMVGITAIAILAPRQPRDELTETITRTSEKFAIAAAMRQCLVRAEISARKIRLTFDFSGTKQEMQAILAERKKYLALEAQLNALRLNDKEAAIIAETAGYQATVAPIVMRAEELVMAYNPGHAAQILATQVSPLHEKWLAAIDRLVELQNDQIRNDVSEFNVASIRADRGMLGIAAVAVILAGIVAWLLTRSITMPLKQAVNVARAVAGGNLDMNIRVATRDEAGQLLRALQDMVVSLREARQLMRTLAYQDGLTAVANRRHFDDTLDREWQRFVRSIGPQHISTIKDNCQEGQPTPCSELSLLLIDVDHFKSYNDNFGHQAGDECLKKIAAAITKELLRPGDLAARYGGEEFSVVLPNTSFAGAAAVAERIRSAVEAMQIQGASPDHPFVTVSIGAASMTPTRGNIPAQLIALADSALYQAKDLGRNRVVLSGAGDVKNGLPSSFASIEQ